MEDEFLLRWGDLDVEILDRTNGVLQVRVTTNATTGPLTWVDASGVTSLAGRRVVAAPSTIEVLSTANGGNGISLRDGAVANALDAVIAESNGDSGVVNRGCPATRLRHLRAYGNQLCGVQLIAVDRPAGEFTFDCRGNRAAGLRLENGTPGIGASGTSIGDSIGVELRDAATTRNHISARIDASKSLGALVTGATGNSLDLRILNCAGVGLQITGGARENQFPLLQINHYQNHGLQISGLGTSGNRLPNPRIGVPFDGERAGNDGDGIRVEDGAGANQFGDEGGAGMRFRGASDPPNRVLHAVIEEDSAIGRIQISGLVLEDGVTGMHLDDATIVGHPDVGIDVRDSPRNDFGVVAKTNSGNHLVRNGTGLRLRGTATAHCRVAGNSIVQNAIGLSL